MVSIRLLARAAEVHDEDTGNHIIRCNEYAYLMAKKVGMPEVFCKEIHYSAQLHDIGKMSVNSAILTKRGRLDEDESFEMNQPHDLWSPNIGAFRPLADGGRDRPLSP